MSAVICSMWWVARGSTSGRVIRTRLGIGQERRQVALGDDVDGLAGRGGAADDLVVDVGDVHHPGHRVAAPAQVADEQVGEQERAEVADVGRSVDGRAARVDTDPVGAQRLERAGLARQRVVQAEAHRIASTVAMTSAEIDSSGALGPVEVAARGLDADGVAIEPEERRDRLAHRSEMGAEPRPGGDDGQVHAGRAPAGGLDPAADLLDQHRARDAARRPVVGREDRSEVAQRRSPRAGRRPGRGGRRRRPSGRPAPARPRSRRRRGGAASPARTGGCRGRCPSASRRVPASTVAARCEIARQRHLEVARIAWHDMDRDATGFEQGGLVGEGRGAVRRVAPPGLAEQVPSDALRRLRRPERGPVDRRPDPLAVDPLERLRDGHDRDRRAVAGGGRRDRRDERRLDQRPGRVVDEHHPGRVRRVPVERREPGVDGLLAALAARDDLDDARRQPARGRDLGASLRRGDDHDPGDSRAPRRARRASRRAADDRRSRRRACRCRPSGSTGRRRRR